MLKLKKMLLPAVVAVVALTAAACEAPQNVQTTQSGSTYTITWDDPNCATENSCAYYLGATAFLLDVSPGHSGGIVGTPCASTEAVAELLGAGAVVGQANSCDIDLSGVPAGDYVTTVWGVYNYNQAQIDNSGVMPPWMEDQGQFNVDIYKCWGPLDAAAWDASQQPGGTSYDGGWYLKQSGCAAGSMRFGNSIKLDGSGGVQETTGGVTVTATAPGVPTNVNAVAGNAAAKVTWNAPDSDGGAAIDYYEVWTFDGTNESPNPVCHVTDESNLCSVTGLQNNTVIAFRIRAHNAVGYSDHVDSNPVTPQSPISTTIGTSEDFTVLAAAPRADVFTFTGYNQTHTSNGSEWYLTNGYGSFGFAPAGMTINQNSADVSGFFDNNKDGYGQRLSWHTNSDEETALHFDGGWRAGSHAYLNSDTSEWRVIYESNNPTYYPGGPQNNVTQATVNGGGWTPCFAEPYGIYGTNVAAVMSACDGDYLLVGGIAGPENVVVRPEGFTVTADSHTVAIGGSTTIRIYNGPANKSVALRIGGKKVWVETDGNGDGTYDYYVSGDAGSMNLAGKVVKVRSSVKINGSLVSAEEKIYVPKLVMRATFREGRAIQATARGVAPGSEIELFVTNNDTGDSMTACQDTVDNGGTYVCSGQAPKAGNYTIVLRVGGQDMATNSFTVVGKPGAA